MIDDPSEYDKVFPEAKQAVQYWISKAIRPGKRINPRSSYGLKHDYERESSYYLSNGEFKGAMLAAGYAPMNEDEQNWVFKIRPTYDKRSIPHRRASEHYGFPMFRINLMGEPDEELHRLLERVKGSESNEGCATTVQQDWR